MEKTYLSTVTPVYRGAAYLPALVAELAQLRESLSPGPLDLAEAIFVDDSSIDHSQQVLAELAAAHPWVRVVQLSRNFGQHAATAAGILHSSGDWVATFDEDLQLHPQQLLPMLLHAAREGADVVYAAPQGKVHRTWYRDLASRMAKWAAGKLTGNPEVVKFSSFRVIRGSVARAAASVAGPDTYFDIVLGWFTDRIGRLPLPLRDVRSAAGETGGYSFGRLLGHARRMVVSSQIKPLRFGALIGLVTLVGSVALAIAVLIVKLVAPQAIQVRGWTSLILIVLFLGGLTALLVGVALEYLSTMHLQVKGKPIFFIVDRSKDQTLLTLADSTPR